MTTGQDQLIYKCQCGFTHSDKKTFSNHLMLAGQKDGKGVHKSLGRVNSSTGEIVMPPFDQRTKEQKQASTYALKKKDGETGGSIRQTEMVAAATQIKFVPRVLVCSLTPVMLAAWAADQELWGWPSDMPFEEVIGQWAIHFHRDRGVELTSYVIKNPAEHAAIRARNLAQVGAAGKTEEKQGGSNDN